jgi:hypothetical protein
MDILIKIEKLAKKARGENIPDFDLSDSIMAQIEQQGGVIVSFRAFDYFAAFAAAAASIALIYGVQALLYSIDPVVELFATIQETPLW